MKFGANARSAWGATVAFATSMLVAFSGMIPAEAAAPLGNSTFLAQTQTQNLAGINGVSTNTFMAQSVTLNGVVYFISVSPATGAELYSTDGTTANTNLVKDLWTGSTGYSTNLNVSHGKLYYQSNSTTGSYGYEPYKSDGTGGGTVILKDINPNSAGSYPSQFTQGPNGLTFFIADDGTRSTNPNATTTNNGYELWVTDGTAENTQKVKDINTFSYLYNGSYNQANSNINNLTSCNGKMFFTANDNMWYSNYTELWVSDGTAAGTQMVKDINTSTTTASYTLWSAATNTTINAGSPVSLGSEPSGLTCMGNNLYFAANDGSGRTLWKTDGTAVNTTKLRTAADGSTPADPTSLFAYGDKLLFSATANAYGPSSANYGTELWITDGTTAGTTLLKDIYASSVASNPSKFVNYNGQVYFSATDYRGTELWKTDGTTVGTLLVKDINLTASGSSSTPNYFYVWNNKLYFTADDGYIGRELYVTLGTGVTTTLVKDVFPGVSDILDVSNYASNQPYFAGSTNALIFVANSPIYGQEMWRTDGSEAGTTLLQDLNTNPGSANAHDGIAFNGKIYFSAASAYYGQELWSTDLTTGNTQMVYDIYPGASSGMDATNSYFVIFNGRLYFSARNAITGWELWSTDGTAAGTSVAADLYPGYGNTGYSFGPNYLTVCNGKIFYAEYTGYYGLAVFNGTTATNVINNHLFPANLACFNNTLYFSGQNYPGGSYDAELWKTDGSSAGTSLFFDSYPGVQSGTTGYSGSPANLTVYNNKLYYTATSGTNGTELYVTDGATTPTMIDIYSGAYGSSPNYLKVYKGELWFKANNGTNGSDLMSYDGTTLTARDLIAGYGGLSMDGNVVIAGDLLWFRGYVSATGYELWSSDGTAANSGVFEDLSPSTASTTMVGLTAIGGVLMYNTYDSVMGSQPRFVVVSAVSTVTFNSNGATSGTAPADISVMSVSATIPGNTGAMVKTGFDFVGWNTSASGTGTTYLPGSTISPIVDTPLYAMWASQTSYTVTYNANSATGGTVAPPVTGVTAMITLDTNSGVLTRTGYSFGGWNTLANGTGTNYSSGARYTPTANVTLYAKWNALTAYTITYSLNGATGTAPATLNTYATATITLAGQGSMVAPAGKTFAGWNTNAAGSGTSYAAAETLSPQASMTLYAQWSAVAPSTLTYDANASTSGTVPTALVASGTYVVIDANTGNLAKTGYVFSGWNTLADGTGTTYQGTDNYLLSANVTLYAKWVVANYTVTFSGNSNTGGTVPAAITGVAISTTLPANSGNLVRAGYSFVGWNTLPSGLGTAYATGATFSPTSSTTLYAQWTAVTTYTITYSANGATGGGVPVAQSGVYAAVTLDNNSGNLVKSGSYFAGWNTLADGTGTNYTAGSSYTPTANVTLYANWSVSATYTISYFGNSNTSGTAPLPQTGITGSTSVLGNTGSLARLGYRFDGWNTAANGSGTAYVGGASITPVADTSLYAQWVSVPTYTITFNGNSQTSGSIPSAITSSDVSVTLPGNTGVLNKTNYIFNGWNTNTGGTGTHYDVGAAFPLSANTTLYAEWLGNIYTITYNANNPDSGTAPAATSGRGTLTTATNTGNLVKAGYTFGGWNTMSDGTGTTVTAGGTYAPTANLTLFAKWNALPTYTVTYNGNTNTSGTAPTATTSYLAQTVAGAGSLAKTSYVFTGWNTAANGSGTAYSAGANYSAAANVTLYAQWGLNYQISYDANGASSGLVPATQTGLAGAANVATNIGNLALAGYNFAGWNTLANGTGTSYAAGASITSNSDVVLYAKWTLIPTYTLSYNSNGATGGSAPTSQTGIVSSATTASAGSLVLAGYNFAGWNTLANGNGTAYAASASITISANTTLYAQWALIPTYAVTYSDNGSTGGTAPVSISGVTGSTVLDNNSGALVRDGYTFQGWNTMADGSGTGYLAGATVTLSSNVTLYAQWTSNGPTKPKFVVGAISKRQLELTGGTVTITGERLNKVEYVSMDGQRLTIVSANDSSLVLVITAHAVGIASLYFVGDGAQLTFVNAVEFVAPKLVAVSTGSNKTSGLATSAFNSVMLAIKQSKPYSNVAISFGTTVSGSASRATITLRDNAQLLKLAMMLANFVNKNISVSIKVTGNVNQIELTFTNS